MQRNRVSNTQIYLDCRRLLDMLLDATPDFPRSYKFSIGSRMHDIAISMLLKASAAYAARSKDSRLERLDSFQADFEVLKTLVRVAGERKWIRGLSRHADIVERMDAIHKQSCAWRSSLIKGTAGQ